MKTKNSKPTDIKIIPGVMDLRRVALVDLGWAASVYVLRIARHSKQATQVATATHAGVIRFCDRMTQRDALRNAQFQARANDTHIGA